MEELEKIKLEKDIDLAAFRYWSDSFDVESGRENGSESSFRDGALSPEAKAFHTQGMYTEEDMIEFAQFYFNYQDDVNHYVPNSQKFHNWLKQKEKES